MNTSSQLKRNDYISKNVGEFPEMIDFCTREYEKVDDLRYGTNPHQPAAYYRPVGTQTPIGSMRVLKTGKSGLSQTNLEDISYALNIVKYFKEPACAVMKHVNPSGVEVGREAEELKSIYSRARDCDPRAAFGSAIAFNTTVDVAVAEEIMSTFVECVVAPDITDAALEVFNDQENFKLNRHIRVLKCGDLSDLPKYIGDESDKTQTVKVLADGSLIVAAPLLTGIRNIDDIKIASGENKRVGKQTSKIEPTQNQLEDLMVAWYVNLNVRSNGVVIVKNKETLAVGTGEQDRVGSVEQAISKFDNKYEGLEELAGAAMASDGFFPFEDAVEIAAKAGITAIISPAGSLRDADVIKRANELNISLLHAPERIFSHH